MNCAVIRRHASSGIAGHVLDLERRAYVTDERTTTIAEAWTIDATVTAGSETAQRAVHLAPRDGEVSWFSDCGDPLP